MNSPFPVQYGFTIEPTPASVYGVPGETVAALRMVESEFEGPRIYATTEEGEFELVGVTVSIDADTRTATVTVAGAESGAAVTFTQSAS